MNLMNDSLVMEIFPFVLNRVNIILMTSTGNVLSGME